MVGRCIELFRSEQLTIFLKSVSFLGDGIIVPIGFVVLVGLLFYFNKEKVVAIILPLAAISGQLVKAGLKNYFKVPRPEAFSCDILTNYGDRYSFPSGHTIFYAIVFSWLIYFALKKTRDTWSKLLLVFSIACLLLIGYSRVYLGAHWYLDVIAGYLVGGTIFVVSYLIYKYVEGK